MLTISSSQLEQIFSRCEQLSLVPTPTLIFVSISEQKLFFFNNNQLTKTYNISTSRKPPSCKENSLGTPNGLHKVNQKIGENLPKGIVLKGRVPTDQFYFDADPIHLTPGNLLITSRILWLSGLEPGLNRGNDVDTFNRYIYIHGTNNEKEIGTPISQGCVLMKNDDVIELFDQTPLNSFVFIS